jgi:hypothetical protein
VGVVAGPTVLVPTRRFGLICANKDLLYALRYMGSGYRRPEWVELYKVIEILERQPGFEPFEPQAVFPQLD